MSNNQLSTFRIKQLEAEVNNLFANLIDMSDREGKKANDRQQAWKSRALAAYSLHILAEVSPSEAAQAVVDGYDIMVLTLSYLIKGKILSG